VVVLNLSKPLVIETSRKGADASIIIAAEDRLSLDVVGVEFEHQASGLRRFIPWAQVVEMHQPL
jgi:hypothetical protein